MLIDDEDDDNNNDNDNDDNDDDDNDNDNNNDNNNDDDNGNPVLWLCVAFRCRAGSVWMQGLLLAFRMVQWSELPTAQLLVG